MILAFFVSVTAIMLLARLFASMIVFALPLYCAGLSAMYAWQHGLGIPAAVLAAAASAFALALSAAVGADVPSAELTEPRLPSLTAADAAPTPKKPPARLDLPISMARLLERQAGRATCGPSAGEGETP